DVEPVGTPCPCILAHCCCGIDCCTGGCMVSGACPRCCPGKWGAAEATPNIEAKTFAATSLSSYGPISVRGRLGTRTFSGRPGTPKFACLPISAAPCCGCPKPALGCCPSVGFNQSGSAFISIKEDAARLP